MTEELVIGEVGCGEMDLPAGVLARGMRDNPLHVAAFGQDAARIERTLEGLFGGLLSTVQRVPVCARRGGVIVGVLGLAPPGACQPPPSQVIRLLPVVLRRGPASTVRTVRWLLQWQRRDPKEPHWHLGPVAVERGLQGQGIGSRMMERFVEIVDAAGEAAYLETDKPENVHFYERFGFEVVDEAEVLGVTNWFMWRAARVREGR